MVESNLPSSVSPVLRLIAALLAITVPRIVVPVARLTAPSTFQNTLQASVPLINFTFALVPEENVPCSLKINTAFGLPFPSKIKSPAKVIVELVTEYTPALSVSPFPIILDGKYPGVVVSN